MSQKKSKGWPVIGNIVENTTKDGKKFRSVKFADNVEIYVDGEKIAMNEYRNGNLVTPSQELEGLIDKGLVKEEDIEFRREKVAELTWLKHKIVVPPPRD